MNLLVCPHCGERTERPRVEDAPELPATDAVLRCHACDGTRPFHRLPLLCVTGPSGTGKSTLHRLLSAELAERFVLLEQDVLWVAGLRDDTGDHRTFRQTWLRMIAMLHQSGRPAIIFGTVAPPEFESLPERALFESIAYLCLTCDPEPLAGRLRARPTWREWHEDRVTETLEFNHWVRAQAHRMDPPMALVDTTDADPARTAAAVLDWVISTSGS